MTRFGDFAPLCTQTPSYTWCNLFYRQLSKQGFTFNEVSANPATAPVGINPDCGIPRPSGGNDLPNIANIIACALSMFVILLLVLITTRRKAAVGRVEFRIFLALYFLTLPLQLITTGAFLRQGSTPLVILTAIHAGVVAALFWTLLANSLIATQVVEDGTLSSLIPLCGVAVAFFAVTTYISLDVALGFTSTFGPSVPPQDLHSTPLFIFTSIWPAAAALLYFGTMAYIVLGILKEVRPMWYYILSATLFVLSQLAYFLLSKVICKGSKRKVDGSFIATVLETASACVLYLAWKSITEESWEDEVYYPT